MAIFGVISTMYGLTAICLNALLLFLGVERYVNTMHFIQTTGATIRILPSLACAVLAGMELAAGTLLGALLLIAGWQLARGLKTGIELHDCYLRFKLPLVGFGILAAIGMAASLGTISPVHGFDIERTCFPPYQSWPTLNRDRPGFDISFVVLYWMVVTAGCIYPTIILPIRRLR